MKQVVSFLRKYSFYLLVLFLISIIFSPIYLKNQIPFSSNLLVSFFNPWSQEKFPGWEQGIPNKPDGIDDIRIFYPQKYFTIENLKNFQIPFWDPKIFSGDFHAGLSETGVFYPLSLLFLILPQLPVWIFLIVIEPIIASIGMYLFARRIITSKAGAIFAAISFGFSGLVLVRMVEGLSVGHTLIWVPFVLYGVESYFQSRKTRYILITLAAMSLSLLAGWFQFAFYTIVLGFLYACFRWSIEKNKKKNLKIFLSFILLPLVTLFHSIPSIEMFALSSRGATSTKELLDLHLMPWSHLLTYIFPDFWGNPGSYNFFGKSEYKESILYIGVIPFILSLFTLGKKNKYMLFFASISILGIFLGVDTSLTRVILNLPIPIVSSFLPDRVFFFATVGLTLLSGYGLEMAINRKIRWWNIIIVLAIVGGMVTLANGYIFSSVFSHLGFISQAYQLVIAKRNLYLPDIFVGCFIALFALHYFSKKLFIVGVFILTIGGQIYFAGKYIPFSQPQFVFPPNQVFSYLQQHGGMNRYIAVGNGYITSDSSLYYNLYSPDGVGSMYIGRYGQLVTYAQTKGKDFIHIPRVEIRIDPSADDILSGTDTSMLRFMQIDGIKYVVRLKSDPATVKTTLFTKVWENKTWEIYSYNLVLPRIFWTNNFAVSPDVKTNLHTIFTSVNTRVTLEKNPGFKSNLGQGTVEVKRYDPQNIIVQTSATDNGILYVSDNYSGLFNATVDGKPVPILKANYTFEGIALPTGKHNVKIFYSDFKETIAFAISLIAISGIIMWAVKSNKKKNL